MTEEIDRKWLTEDAIDQLKRYGGGVETDDIARVLWELSQINDDIAHNRDASIVNRRCEHAKSLLDRITTGYEGERT